MRVSTPPAALTVQRVVLRSPAASRETPTMVLPEMAAAWPLVPPSVPRSRARLLTRDGRADARLFGGGGRTNDPRNVVDAEPRADEPAEGGERGERAGVGETVAGEREPIDDGGRCAADVATGVDGTSGEVAEKRDAEESARNAAAVIVPSEEDVRHPAPAGVGGEGVLLVPSRLRSEDRERGFVRDGAEVRIGSGGCSESVAGGVEREGLGLAVERAEVLEYVGRLGSLWLRGR